MTAAPAPKTSPPTTANTSRGPGKPLELNVISPILKHKVVTKERVDFTKLF